MATQFVSGNSSVLLPPPIDICSDQDSDASREFQNELENELRDEHGNVFRGFFFAMLFNLLMFLSGAAGWLLWRLIQ